MKLWVVTFGYYVIDEGCFRDQDIAVCSSRAKAREIAQRYVVEPLKWCVESESPDYDESCTPDLHPSSELWMVETNDELTDISIQGFELDKVLPKTLNDTITVQ